jgi:antitoxin HicB
MARYPALTAEDDGGYSVTVRDLPEVVAQGDTRDQARAAAVDAVAVALEFRIKDDEPWPAPCEPTTREELIVLPALVEAKLALFRRMHETATSKTALARQLGVSEGAVRKLLRFDHRSHIGQIEAALHALGQRLEVHARDAA